MKRLAEIAFFSVSSAHNQCKTGINFPDLVLGSG